MNNEREREIRYSIRSIIKHVKKKRLNEETQLRAIIRGFIDHEMKNLNESQVADTDPSPNKSTGINVLEDLLKKIIPVLEADYKILTTSEEQRNSFRSHVIQAIVNTLKPVEVNNKAVKESVKEEIDIEISDDKSEQDKFIDIRTDSEKKADEEPEDPRSEFGIDGQDETGRNMAYSSFKKVETSVIDSFELLSAEEDKELFHDYLIANVKLYFDKFETELSGNVKEPTNQAYDVANQDLEEPTEDEIELGL
jgi:hypothetical protein|tara:strand:+ start:11299 stop:12054 length:756 start_codon:yes stop_codon:yes gene_type:complete